MTGARQMFNGFDARETCREIAAQSFESGLVSQRVSGHDRSMDQAVKRDPRHTIGAIGEAAVRERMTALNWLLVDYNVRWRDGELDAIALDQRTIVFVEVKTLRATRNSGKPAFSPFESIGPRKQGQLRKLARRWLSEDLRRQHRDADLRFESIRFDAFAVTVNADDKVTSIEHLEDAF